MKSNASSLGRSWTAALVTGTITMLAPAAALAQTESVSPPETVRSTADGKDTIVVVAKRYVPQGGQSAMKSDIPLIETPQSISVITRDQIDLLAFVDVQQAVRYTAGAFGENYGPDLRFDFITVRGFTPKQYIDGLAAPISTSIYSVGVDLYAFDSIDILKGPAAVLYGNSPPGGIYNLTSRRPSKTFSGELSAKYGSDDYKQVMGTYTTPLTDSLSAAVTGMYLDRDAERDLVQAERALFSPAVTWEIGPRTKITGLFYSQFDKVRGDTNGFLPVYGTLLPNPLGRVDPSVNLGDPFNVYERDQWGAGWDFSHEFADNITFHSNTKWSHYDEDTPTGIYGGGGLVDADFNGVPDDYRTVQQFNFSYKESVRSFATDNRLDMDFAAGGLNHKVITGVDYRQVDNKADFGFIFANTIDLFNPVYAPQATYEPGYPFAFNNQRLEQVGLYAQDHIEIGKFFVTVSGRQDWVEIKNLATGVAKKQDKFTYRVGANYVFDSGFAPYVSYATSFEPVLGVDSVTGKDFEPSEGEQVEAGVKWDARNLPDGMKLLVTASAFQIKQTNVVSTAPAVTPVFGTQSGEVEVKGAEIEVVSRFFDQLSINGSYSFTDSEVTKSQVAAEIGQPLPTTPENKASLFADYTLSKGLLAGLGLGLGVRYTSGSNGALTGAFKSEEATLVDGILHFDMPDWRFSLNASNLLDELYVARCAGPAGCTYGAGRQVIGTITRKF